MEGMNSNKTICLCSACSALLRPFAPAFAPAPAAAPTTLHCITCARQICGRRTFLVPAAAAAAAAARDGRSTESDD
ncbi:hypothetical protein CSUB01_09495 [Colletotrichum sublineola]|uniref:Uncharacterized protein n=1 Tax=Colletotrichum sublineola TaxID=1173701 RepID=A0A066X3T4_COLSU|nr:hypothetical protein CSUB01_09495 [Colletotrichum sublineola]